MREARERETEGEKRKREEMRERESGSAASHGAQTPPLSPEREAGAPRKRPQTLPHAYRTGGGRAGARPSDNDTRISSKVSGAPPGAAEISRDLWLARDGCCSCRSLGRCAPLSRETVLQLQIAGAPLATVPQRAP